jgi:hypothetical protein
VIRLNLRRFSNHLAYASVSKTLASRRLAHSGRTAVRGVVRCRAHRILQVPRRKLSARGVPAAQALELSNTLG